MRPLNLAITDIANDLYTLYAWITGKIDGPPIASTTFKSLPDLHELARCGDIDLVKVSFAAIREITDNYKILPVGCTIVSDGGPILVTKRKSDPKQFSQMSLAIPGEGTTAHLLSSLLPKFGSTKTIPYGEISAAVATGAFDYGLLIHTPPSEIASYGLRCTTYLIETWRAHAGGGLPLGGFAINNRLSAPEIADIVAALKRSLAYAHQNHDEAVTFIAEVGPIKNLSAIESAIKLWINSESEFLTATGRQSIRSLLDLACDVHNQPRLKADTCFTSPPPQE